MIAKGSSGVARPGVRMLEGSKRTASAASTDNITPAHVERMFQESQIDSLGLDPVEQHYLHILRDVDGPVRLNVIATHLGLPRKTVEVLEEDFIRLGLVTKSDKGRMLTPKGIEHLAGSSE